MSEKLQEIADMKATKEQQDKKYNNVKKEYFKADQKAKEYKEIV